MQNPLFYGPLKVVCVFTPACKVFNVTLLVEMKDKEFTSHKAKYALQFGTNNNMIGLSLTFKSIKQKIQFSQHSELISFLMF